MTSDASDKNRNSEKLKSSQQEKNSSCSRQKNDDIDESETQGKRLGRCKWFNVAKGWGFITPNDGRHDVFVHQSVIQMPGFRSLAEGEEIEFECKITPRGLEATSVAGPHQSDCHGSEFRPRTKRRYRRIRCYNCGSFANHIAAKCTQDPQPKKCHFCKSEDHLVADCPNKKNEEEDNSNKSTPKKSS